MAEEKIRVIEKLSAQCQRARQAQKPMIMVDTEEIEVMELLARTGGLVDLVQKETEEQAPRFLKYLRYTGEDPINLHDFENYSEDPATLLEIAAVQKMKDSKVPPRLVVLHLLEETIPKVVANLRAYVHSYVTSMEKHALVRSSCVLLYGNPGLLPKDLTIYTEVLSVEYPRHWEIAEVIAQEFHSNGYDLLPEVREELADLMVGFSLFRVREYTRRMLNLDMEKGKPLAFVSKERKKIILDAKAQAIWSVGGLLTLYRDPESENCDKTAVTKSTQKEAKSQEKALGGMGYYQSWVKDAGDQMLNNSEYALKRGVDALKGILLCGVPGCGKSEAAKVLHKAWGLPMLCMDVDRLMGGYLGDSERNMRQALALAEAMAPCIVWIEEIDKGFSAAAADNKTSDTFKRVFGRLLTWMQENKKPCFSFATANQISQLPPELFRSGRFDALFSVFMPTHDECVEIFENQMRSAEKKRKDAAEEKGGETQVPDLFDRECYDQDVLQKIMDLVMLEKDPENPRNIKFMTGADIKKIVKSALKKLPEETLSAPIPKGTWLNALQEVITDPTITTQGSSQSGLDKIAACYVRLLRENFTSVSDQKQTLFFREHYQCIEDGQGIRVEYTGDCKLDWAYDRAMFQELKPRIEKIGSILEASARAQI